MLSLRQWPITMLLLGLLAPPAAPQTGPAQPDTQAQPQPPRYLLPDLDPAALVFDGNRFWFKPIIGVLADYTWFDQDQPSLTQVGEQADQANLRSARFGLAARLKSRPRVELVAILDYIEPKRRDDRRYEVLDLALAFPLSATSQTKVTVGKQKQPFAYEMFALAALLPQQERILSPFFLSRDVGVRFTGTVARDRVSYAVGWFNDWWLTGRTLSAGGNDYVLRLTTRPLASADGRRYLHLGLGGRSRGAEDGVLRFRGRPESDVADYYIDTGNIPGSHATELSLEALGVWRRWSLLGEWVRATVDDSAGLRPRFGGAYLTASWIVTGEHRPYERAFSGARSPVPARRAGAWEVVGRYSWVDATDRGVDGGELTKWYAGINWWASIQWKAGVGYGVADLLKGGLDGHTGIAMMRLQWLY
jgi:phosphate-selective porin OprO/OprP